MSKATGFDELFDEPKFIKTPILKSSRYKAVVGAKTRKVTPSVDKARTRELWAQIGRRTAKTTYKLVSKYQTELLAFGIGIMFGTLLVR